MVRDDNKINFITKSSRKSTYKPTKGIKYLLSILSIGAAFTSTTSAFHLSTAFQRLPLASVPTATSPSKSTSLSMKIPVQKLANYANSYAAANGLQVEIKSSAATSTTQYQCAPISLLPNAFPATSFENAKELAPYFNLLVDRISKEGTFLKETLGHGDEHGVVSKDAYTKKLLELYIDIYMEENENESKPNFAKEADKLGIQRSDYMLNPIPGTADDTDTVSYGLKQVELNTIAASFAGLAVNIAGLHKMLTERFDGDVEVSEYNF